MEMPLKGLYKVPMTLSGGRKVHYYYAWRGGPRIKEEPGTPAFVETFHRLVAARDNAKNPIHDRTLLDLITAYQDSPAFLDLALETRKGYARRILKIETKFGTLPIKALEDPRVRGIMLDWRDQLAKTSRREADYHLTVLARILSWAHDRRKIMVNPLEKPGRVYSGSRVDSVWTDAEFLAFRQLAAPHVFLPALIARETGQRLGDILALTWSAYDSSGISLRQSKTGKHVYVPVTQELKAALDATPRTRAVTICVTSRNVPWTRDGYQTSFNKARLEAKVIGRTFHDFRGTAITRLAEAGCTVPEIATITGHELTSVESILSRHYLARSRGLGESAISKLEKHKARTVAVKGTVKRPLNRGDASS